MACQEQKQTVPILRFEKTNKKLWKAVKNIYYSIREKGHMAWLYLPNFSIFFCKLLIWLKNLLLTISEKESKIPKGYSNA